MKLNQLSGTHQVRVRIPAQGTAGTDETYAVMSAPDNIKITGARLIFDAAITGAATNHAAFGVVNEGDDGTGTTAITDVHAFDDGVNAVAHVPVELDVSATEANVVVEAGEVVSLARTTPGNGQTTPAGVLEVDYIFLGEG